jgi:hypothetical protein
LNFNVWMEALKNPIQTFKKEKKNADLTEGAKNIALAGLITGLISGLVFLVVGSIYSMANPYAMGLIGIPAFVAILIVSPIVSVIGWLISSGIYYLIARLLGGRGDYKTQSYLIALYSAPMGIVITVLNLVPILGSILSLLGAIYSLYLLTLSLKETHGFSTGKAVLTWLIPFLVIAVIAIAVALVFAVALVSLIASNGSPMPYGI